MLLPLVLAAGIAIGLASPSVAVNPKTIHGNIVLSSNHTILAAAIGETRLEKLLNAGGANTYFAPTDEAFKKLGDDVLKALIDNKDLLKKIVQAHLRPGENLFSKDLRARNGQSLNGFAIAANGELKIGRARVIKADLECENGVLHVIDTVLIPE